MITIRTNPGVPCTIVYTTPSGTTKTAPGLEPKTADAAGNVTWSWEIFAGTELGAAYARMTCAGLVATSQFVIN